MKLLAFDNLQFYLTLILSIINGVLMCFASYKFFQIIQLSNYKFKGYFLWLKDTKCKYVSRLILLSLLSIFCVLVTNALFDVYHSNALYSYLGLIFYFYFTIVFIVNLYYAPKKIPLKNTTRMTRLTVFMFIFVSAISFFLTVFSTEYLGFVKFGAICLVPMFLPLIVPFVHIILIPLEKLIVFNYVLRAKKKLSSMPNLIKIGITGSFGKTSTKYILNTILSQKYSVCMSPHSFNTLTGLCKVVNNYITADHQILIAEMGARRVGDIKELCNLINPTYAVITGIGSQHLLSFKSLGNIKKTKNELIQSLPKDMGKAFFNGENINCLDLYDRCNVDKYIVGNHKDSKFKAKDISFDEKGTSFKLMIEDKEYDCFTKLLGKHNVENILLCVAIAKEFKLTDKQIIDAIKKLEPIPHRLELIKTQDNIILDDSYNASVEGSTMALEILKNFSGRKVVVTPGLVELGNKEKQENKSFGLKISKTADLVIIVNTVNFEDIKKGLIDGNFSEDNIYQAETLDKAKILLKELLKQGDVVLFENDLPDNYI